MSGHHRASPNPPSRAGRTPARPRQEWPKDAILDRLDIEHEYEAMGLRFGRQAISKGWRPCYSKAREERKPSAGVNVETGHYKDHAAEGGESLTFWDFAIKYGNVGPDFPSVIAHFADKAGVKLQTAATIPTPPPKSGQQKRSGQIRADQDTSTPSQRPAKGHPTALSAIEAWSRKNDATVFGVWCYRDAAGSEVLYIARFHDAAGKKEYRPFRRSAGGGWMLGDPPGLLPLYGLPDLAGPGRVFVFEGEKVRDIGRDRLGLLATASSHGAGSASKSDWSPLAGREVVIVPDAGKVGDGYAADVVKILGQLAPRPSIRLLKLPGLAEGEDLEQWLERAPELWEPERCREEIERLADRAPDPTKPAPPTDEEIGLVCLASIEPKPVEWLWEGRIPRGKITLLAGEGEIGKSFLTLDLIARLTTGRGMPDRPDVASVPCDCVFVTAEDGLDDTIVPRLIGMGADLERVHTIVTGRSPNGRTSPFTIADIDKLEHLMARRPGVWLIVIDPIAAFLGRVDENKNAELRGLLGPLADFAGRYGVAIVAITHFGKNPTTKATARILGSVAYSNAARATWCVIPDPDDRERRLMLRVKNNLSADRTGMAYAIRDGRVDWEPEPIDLHANDVLGRESKSRSKEERDQKVVEVIRRVLAGGQLTKDEVMERCAAEGVGRDRVWNNREAAGVICEKEKTQKGRWFWRLANVSGSVLKNPESGSVLKNPDLFPSGEVSGEIPGPRPMPEDFEPEVCGRCKQPFGPRGYHAAWHGDEPVAECWDCVEKMGA